MGQLNPLDNSLAERIAGIERQLHDLQRGTNTYFADWVTVNRGDIEYGGAINRVIIRNFGKTLNVGDKLRIRVTETLNTFVAFFYVVASDINDNVDVVPCVGTGDIQDFWFSFYTLGDIAVSKSTNPGGFVPLTDNGIECNVYLNGGSVSIAPASISLGVAFIGTGLLVSLSEFSCTASGSWDGLGIDLPLPADQFTYSGAIRNIAGRCPVFIGRGGTFTNGVSYVDSYDIGTDQDVRIIVEPNTGTIASGSFQIRGHIIYGYDINFFDRFNLPGFGFGL
jgi:hypothetical protein